MKCKLCGKESWHFVACPKENKSICEQHCKTCEYMENVCSLPKCLYKEEKTWNAGIAETNTAK